MAGGLGRSFVSTQKKGAPMQSHGGGSGDITPSNKSSQTPQAASQSFPHSEGSKAGKGILSGAGSHARRRQNSRMGGPQ